MQPSNKELNDTVTRLAQQPQSAEYTQTENDDSKRTVIINSLRIGGGLTVRSRVVELNSIG